MSRKNAPKNEVCICGHPSSVHDLYGTTYARCRDWSSRVKCACEGGVRPALVSHGAKMTRFRKNARGMQRPHALLGAVANFEPEKIEWLITECDSCGKEFGPHGPFVYVLDEDGAIQRPGKPRTNGGTLSKDTGRHVMICAICDYIDQKTTGYEEKR